MIQININLIFGCDLILTGDEVLEWNGCLLQGKMQKEVADIIAESKNLPQIELKVSRSIFPRRASYGTPTKGTQMNKVSFRSLHRYLN